MLTAPDPHWLNYREDYIIHIHSNMYTYNSAFYISAGNTRGMKLHVTFAFVMCSQMVRRVGVAAQMVKEGI